MFDPAYPVERLRGAEYNPRAISLAAEGQLEESLRVIGIAKPVIVNGDLIVAGHQRTKALTRLGVATVPAYLLPAGLTQADEIRFNQLHNGVDLDTGDEAVTVGRSSGLGFEMVPARQITGNGAAKGANLRCEICRLLTRYGNWGACVATQSGAVLHGAQYALACMTIGMPARVYRIPEHQAGRAAELLGAEYGRFDYGHLPRATYVQSFAQPFRLREDAKRANLSELYEGHVLPALRGGERILDFGCGQGDYVRKLKAAGVDIMGVEFFRRAGGANSIDVGAVYRMIYGLCAALKAVGRFDIVLADSVLNSVDTLQAESDVLVCLGALCRPGGTVFYSGRSRERWIRRNDSRRHSIKNGEKAVSFIDGDGFSGIFHHGNWFYQVFRTPEQVRKLTAEHFPEAEAHVDCDSQKWRVRVTKAGDLPEDRIRAALRREFDLLWPQGKSVGRADAILAAYDIARGFERTP